MARVRDNGTVRRFVPSAVPLLLWLCSGCGTADRPTDSSTDRQAGWAFWMAALQQRRASLCSSGKPSDGEGACSLYSQGRGNRSHFLAGPG
jgi:hypothetical protein